MQSIGHQPLHDWLLYPTSIATATAPKLTTIIIHSVFAVWCPFDRTTSWDRSTATASDDHDERPTDRPVHTIKRLIRLLWLLLLWILWLSHASWMTVPNALADWLADGWLACPSFNGHYNNITIMLPKTVLHIIMNDIVLWAFIHRFDWRDWNQCENPSN